MSKVLNARQAGIKPAPDRIYVGRPSRSESVRDRPPRRCPNLAHGPLACRLLPQQQVFCCVAASEAMGQFRTNALHKSAQREFAGVALYE
jgi:hypothetical protein